MATSKEESSTSLDTIKLILALVILTLGVVAYYYFNEHAFLYRVLYVVGGAIVGFGILMTSVTGRNLRSFSKASRTELRKVIWPTRQEALQTTLAVIVMVTIVAIFLWLVDMFLGWGVRSIITGGS